MRNRMELAVGIAIGSSTQIALFVAPLAGAAQPGDGAGAAQPRLLRRRSLLMLMATFVASILIVDGKSTWFTGVQFIAVYLVMAITVFAFRLSASGHASLMTVALIAVCWLHTVIT